jgi:CheY-like chemotaxis protein
MIQGSCQRILIVEDDEQRCAWFRERLTHHECDLTCDVQRAICWLGEREYSLIFLDHDLAEEHYLSESTNDAETGYAVAAWLAAHPAAQPQAAIVVHSLNYVGAERMVDTLARSGRPASHVPFPLLDWSTVFSD